MVVELDTQVRTLVALRAAGVRFVRLHPNGALQSAEFFPLAAAPTALADTLPPPADADDVSGDASGFRVQRTGPTFPPMGER